MKEYAELFRRYCLDYGIKVYVIPRMDCIRIVDRVDFNPDIDITIFLEKDANINNRAAKQYQVRIKDGTLELMSYSELTAKISEEYEKQTCL